MKPRIRSLNYPFVALIACLLCVVAGPAVAFDQAPPQTVPAPADVAAPPADAEKTDSGLCMKVITPGTGTEHPTPADSVTVNYTGWTAEGRMFDSTVVRGKPSKFVLKNVLPGWIEGVQKMVVGEKRRMWVPEKLAFNGMAGRPAGTVVFDIELVAIDQAPAVPPDVKEPPKDAEKTKSGLYSKVLKPGTGTTHPKATDKVTVHYTGWKTDGMMFDSSVTRGQSIEFPLNQVIAGWTEGVQLMVVGEKRRFWIPEELAYRGEREPKGMLVFDVELLAINGQK